MALICQIVRWSRNGNTEEAATVCARCSPGQVAPFAVQRMGSASSPASGNHATGSIAVAAGSALLDIPGTVRTAATIASTTRLGAELASGGGITTTAPLIAGGTVGTYLYGTYLDGGIDSRPPHGRLRRADPGQASDQRHQSAGATRHSSLAATSDWRKHSVLLAENRPAEPCLDVGDRSHFANGDGAIVPDLDFPSRVQEPATVCHWKVTGLELYAVKRWIGTLAGLRSVPTAAQKRYSGA